MTSPTHPFCLSQFEFSGSIDYVTFATSGEQDLPLTLAGRPRWGVAANYKQLTVHDLQPGDVPQLTRAFGRAPLLGLEVTIDARPVGKHLGLDERARLLDLGIQFLAMHLYPYGEGLPQDHGQPRADHGLRTAMQNTTKTVMPTVGIKY
jgi:hypothetical protein